LRLDRKLQGTQSEFRSLILLNPEGQKGKPVPLEKAADYKFGMKLKRKKRGDAKGKLLSLVHWLSAKK